MANYILGISCFYHDSSVTLLKDGKIVAAIEEERLSRLKHDNSFPENAINYCLSVEGITFKDIEKVAFYEIPSLKFHRYISQHISHAPFSFNMFAQTFPSWIKEKLQLSSILKEKYKFHGEIDYVKHHLAHAASSYFVSGFGSAAYVTLDGVGEWETSTFGTAKDGNITQLGAIHFPHSLGLVYSAITSFLGFSVNDSEYKVMGLAAYGENEREKNDAYKKLQRVINLHEEGRFSLNMEYFDFVSGESMFTKRLENLLGVSPRKSEQTMSNEYQNIATAIQLLTEDVAFAIFNHVAQVTGEEKLVFAGGIALNSVLNGKILTNTKFKDLFIQPAAGDAGGSMGAALYSYFHCKQDFKPAKLESIYLGPAFSDDYIEEFLAAHDIVYTRFPNKKVMISKIAELLHNNNVVGWFQKGMEWGPRALGARSILANPCNPEMQSILNQKVKHREEFRPFAPAVCVDDAQTFFECDSPIPEPSKYMLMVYPVREKFRRKLPSITHVDGSGRLQVVEREDNPDYYDLIKEFGKLSGIPIIINTSFNIKGEPIVCTPKDAFYCMMGTEIDYLAMGNFLIKRLENKNDIGLNKRDYLFYN